MWCLWRFFTHWMPVSLNNWFPQKIFFVKLIGGRIFSHSANITLCEKLAHFSFWITVDFSELSHQQQRLTSSLSLSLSAKRCHHVQSYSYTRQWGRTLALCPDSGLTPKPLECPVKFFKQINFLAFLLQIPVTTGLKSFEPNISHPNVSQLGIWCAKTLRIKIRDSKIGEHDTRLHIVLRRVGSLLDSISRGMVKSDPAHRDKMSVLFN